MVPLTEWCDVKYWEWGRGDRVVCIEPTRALPRRQLVNIGDEFEIAEQSGFDLPLPGHAPTSYYRVTTTTGLVLDCRKLVRVTSRVIHLKGDE